MNPMHKDNIAAAINLLIHVRIDSGCLYDTKRLVNANDCSRKPERFMKIGNAAGGGNAGSMLSCSHEFASTFILADDSIIAAADKSSNVTKSTGNFISLFMNHVTIEYVG